MQTNNYQRLHSVRAGIIDSDAIPESTNSLHQRYPVLPGPEGKQLRQYNRKPTSIFNLELSIKPNSENRSVNPLVSGREKRIFIAHNKQESESFCEFKFFRLSAPGSIDEESRSLNRIVNVFDKTIERWELNSSQRLSILGLDEAELPDKNVENLLCGKSSQYDISDIKSRMGNVIKIGLGLQILFSSNKHAEVRWLNAKRRNLDHLTPVEYMTQGDSFRIINVAELVNRERGL